MAEGGVSFTSFDQILDQQSPNLELVKHAKLMTGSINEYTLYN